MDTIKERLDRLDGGLSGVTFKQELIDNWTVYSSSSGYKYATIEIQKDVSSTIDSGFIGVLSSENLEENLPHGVFNAIPVVDVVFYTNNPRVEILQRCTAPPSETYSGRYKALFTLVPPNTNMPRDIQMVITAQGF